MFTNALYYPYIQIPDNLWLRRAILYWDTISLIVPSAAEKDIPINHVSRELKSCDVLDFIHPEKILEYGEGDELSEYFLKILRSEQSASKISPPKRRNYNIKIHRHKFTEGLLRELRDLDLFKETRDQDWLLFESYTGTIYMGFLASCLANHLKLEPITDREDHQKGFLRSQLTPSDKSTTVSASLVLEELLPAPKEPIPVRKLLKFKENHERELLAFRGTIRSTIESLSQVDERQRQERLEAVKDKIKEQCLVLDRKMKDNGWETVWNAVETPFKLSLQEVGVVGLVGTTYSVPVAIGVLGANAVVKIMREVFHNHRVRRESILEASPYTYVLNVKKKFG